MLNFGLDIGLIAKGKMIDNVLEKLREKYRPGTVVFRDGRKTLVSTYTKLVHGHMTVQVKREAALDYCSHNELDLIEIDGPGEWGGVVVSISGTSADHPSLDEALRGDVGEFGALHIYWPVYPER